MSMLSRLLFALGLALAGGIATTGVAAAAIPDWDRDEVMIVTIFVAIGVAAGLFLVYLIKLYFGLTAAPPPETDDRVHH